jgi:hypothetical protein
MSRKVEIPAGKVVLNTHITVEERAFLKALAKRDGVSLTIAIRRLIWQEMLRGRKASEARTP